MAKNHDDDAAPAPRPFAWDWPAPVPETEPDPVPAATGLYTSGRHLVLRGGQKVCACYPSKDETADEVAMQIAAALNK